MESKEVDKRLLFTGVLFGIPKTSMKPRNKIKPQSINPGKLWDYVKKNITTEGRTESLIEKARNESIRISELILFPDLKKVSSLEKKFLTSLILRQEWKVRHVLFNPDNCFNKPLEQILAGFAHQFITTWNMYIQSLDGLWLFQYGMVNYAELVITNLSDLIELGEKTMEQKILKNLFLENGEKGKQDYRKSKDMLAALIKLLRLHQQELKILQMG